MTTFKGFINKKFRLETLRLIETCNGIIEDYRGMSLDLTVRQLYYQLVSRDLVENTQKSYKRISSMVNDARLAGAMDWDAIVDRGRKTLSLAHWTEPKDILESAANSFRVDKWENQEFHLEVMCEKQALEGVFIDVCNNYDVPFTSNKGYSSQSFMFKKGETIRHKAGLGQPTIILYFGDHDPSGLDMDRDILERLCMFSGCSVEFERVSLSMEQIEAFNPPPNPAKLTDSRCKEYLNRHGSYSWELDAMEPSELRDLCEIKIQGVIDQEIWDETLEVEQVMKNEINRIVRTVERWKK